MKKLSLPLIALLLSSCGELFGPGFLQPGPDTTHPVARPADGPAAPPPNARTVEDFDTTTDAERAEAVAPETAGGGNSLGTTIASLGDASKPGFWMETPLVSAPTKGRVEYKATGKSVNVDLIPIDGPATGGSRISLAAIRLLGAPLTGLPELVVFGGP